MDCRRLAVLIRADDLYLVPDPIGWQINSAAVSTRFYPLFDHFFTVYFEFDFVAGNIGGEFFLISEILIAVLIFIIWHLDLPLSDIKMGAAANSLLEVIKVDSRCRIL